MGVARAFAGFKTDAFATLPNLDFLNVLKISDEKNP